MAWTESVNVAEQGLDPRVPCELRNLVYGGQQKGGWVPVDFLIDQQKREPFRSYCRVKVAPLIRTTHECPFEVVIAGVVLRSEISSAPRTEENLVGRTFIYAFPTQEFG